MASYVVLERRRAGGNRTETEFVRDDFSVVALIVPVVWLLWHRLWFAALMLLLVSVGIGMIGEYLAPGAAIFFAGVAVSLFVALEGPAWRLARFRRFGFSEAGAVIARSIDEAEIRWFSGRAAPRRNVAPEGAKRKTPPPLPASYQSDMMFGFSGER